jgi:hypothetical protein
MKVEEFITDIREGATFGPVCAGMGPLNLALALQATTHCIMNNLSLCIFCAVLYTVEFQKRGLPHIHCLVWLASSNAEFCASTIDKIICAEIPDVNTDPLGYALVNEFMMHDPCGAYNRKCPCMKNDKFSKKNPMAFQNETIIDDFGFTIYRRRDNGRTVSKNGVSLDNRNVVPYNMWLLKKYNAHINVEWCNKSNMIKYLFKYINKGSDRAEVYFKVTAKTPNASLGPDLAPPDEIQEHIDARGLLESDNEWTVLFDKAIVHASSYQLRQLFVMVVLRCYVSNVRALFDKYWLYR